MTLSGVFIMEKSWPVLSFDDVICLFNKRPVLLVVPSIRIRQQPIADAFCGNLKNLFLKEKLFSKFFCLKMRFML